MLDLGVTHIINCAEQVHEEVDDDDDGDDDDDHDNDHDHDENDMKGELYKLGDLGYAPSDM